MCLFVSFSFLLLCYAWIVWAGAQKFMTTVLLNVGLLPDTVIFLSRNICDDGNCRIDRDVSVHVKQGHFGFAPKYCRDARANNLINVLSNLHLMSCIILFQE